MNAPGPDLYQTACRPVDAHAPWRNFLVRTDQMDVDIAARRTRHSRPRAGSRTSNLHGPGHICPAPTPPVIDVLGAKKPGAGSARARCDPQASPVCNISDISPQQSDLRFATLHRGTTRPCEGL